MNSATFWLGGLAFIWSASTSFTAQPELPVQTLSGKLRGAARDSRLTQIAIVDGRWQINGEVTYHGTKAEGLLLNVRMVDAIFEDLKRPDFDAEANTDEFITRISEYVGGYKIYGQGEWCGTIWASYFSGADSR